MREFDIELVAASLPQLVDQLATGEEILLTHDGRGLAKLTPVPRGRSIRLGVAPGEFKVPDDFDAPLPDDLIDLFYNGPLFPDEPTRHASGSDPIHKPKP